MKKFVASLCALFLAVGAIGCSGGASDSDSGVTNPPSPDMSAHSTAPDPAQAGHEAEGGEAAPAEGGDAAPAEGGDAAPAEGGDAAPAEGGDAAPAEAAPAEGDAAPAQE